MSAVWQASRGAVRRRRLQTFVIGLVVMCSTAAVLFALGVLDAASSPFDRAFARQQGAQVVATFDRSKVADARLAATAERPGVEAAAGPFPEAVLRFSKEFLWMPPGTLTVVGRADPGGAVDHLRLGRGRWATAPGEIVVNMPNGRGPTALLGTVLHADGAPPLKVVGFATSISQSAGGWVTPAQAQTLHPAESQMLYRFRAGDTDAQLRTGLARTTAGLPAGALQGSESWLTVRQTYTAHADSYLPLITLFGLLSLIVSVLITANVVSGAVVSGFRHIGVLKAIGFTPNQVVAVYLAMVSTPALAGAVLGTALGTALTGPALGVVFSGIETNGVEPHVGLWVPVVSLLGMPLLVALAALVPALRAHRLSAARAISAGSAPRGGHGLRIQRRLAGTRLPRPLSLGLGQPFARPGRAAMTLAALILGWPR
ncbi:ABC transporter permease [Streptacidiphilus monticola]